MDTVRYGIVGTGMMGVEHIQNLAHIDGVVVAAVCDPDPSSLEIARALVPGVTVFEDHQQLAESGLCDAVVVASPNMTHVDVLVDLLPTDLHLLIEKPLCATVEECYTVLDLAEGRDAAPGSALSIGTSQRSLVSLRRSVGERSDGSE